MLLLGSADHAADPVGHLNIQLARHAAGATPAGMLEVEPTVRVTGSASAPVPSARSANDDSGDVIAEGRASDD